MDVLPVEGDTKGAIWVYAVNHRMPIGPDGKPLGESHPFILPTCLSADNEWNVDATVHGQNSTIELFRLDDVDSHELKHVKTFADPIIATPNDVVGRADGKGFWFTNDNGARKVGLVSTSW